MKLEIISDSRDSAILVGDEHHNDIAEFYHSDHATVSQSYETALALAKQLVAGCGDHAQAGKVPLPEHTCYLERSAVRSILIGQPDENLHITDLVLAEVDALPIVAFGAVPDEDHPDCATTRERELYDALMGIASHATAFCPDYNGWTQGGVALKPIVSKALRLSGSMVPSTHCGSGK